MSNDLLDSLTSKHLTRGASGGIMECSKSEKVPPHDNDAEMSLLGSVLVNNSVLDEVLQEVSHEDFYRPAHRKIFLTIEEMNARGEAVDMITLADKLAAKGVLDAVGGRYYIADLATKDAITKRNTIQHARIIRANSKLRQLVSLGVELTALGYEGNYDDIDNIIGESVRLTTSLAMQHTTSANEVGTIFDEIKTNLERGEESYITPPGMQFTRIKPGDLIVVAAGPGVGKTALTLNWADEWSKQKQLTYFEYEMPERDLLSRLLCKHAGISLDQLQDASLTGEELQRLEDAGQILRTRKLRIEEVWCDIGTLMAKIRQEAQQGSEIVVIDHMGLINFRIPKGMNYARAVGNMVTNPLKRLAAELGIVIVILVQLNREGQNLEHFPKLYHLRDSGEIEQDASIVYMVWSDAKAEGVRKLAVREESGILTDEECQYGKFDLVRVGVEKNRNGRLGEKYLLYHGQNFRYEDRDESTPLYPTDRSMF